MLYNNTEWWGLGVSEVEEFPVCSYTLKRIIKEKRKENLKKRKRFPPQIPDIFGLGAHYDGRSLDTLASGSDYKINDEDLSYLSDVLFRIY